MRSPERPGFLRMMEESLARMDDVTILHHDKHMRANIFEFMIRYPDILLFVDDECIYICPSRKSLDNFRNMLKRREKRINAHYHRIKSEYESTVSLLESVNKYYVL